MKIKNHKDCILYMLLLELMEQSKFLAYFHPYDHSSYTPFSIDICEFYLTRDYLLHKINTERTKSNTFPNPLVTLDLLYKKTKHYNWELQDNILECNSILNEAIDKIIDADNQNLELINKFEDLKNILQSTPYPLTVLEIDSIIDILLKTLNEITKNKNNEYINRILWNLNKLSEIVLLFLISNIIFQFDTLYSTKSYETSPKLYKIKNSPDNTDIATYIEHKQKNSSEFKLESILTTYSKKLIQYVSKKSDRAKTPYFRFNKEQFKTEIFKFDFPPAYYDLSHFEYMIHDDITEYKVEKPLIKKVYLSILKEFDLEQNNSACCIWDLLVHSLKTTSYFEKDYRDYKFPISSKFIKIIDYLESRYQFITKLIGTYLKTRYSSLPLKFEKINYHFPILEELNFISSYSIIGKLFPYHIIQIFSLKSGYSYILDYRYYFFEKSTEKICIPINNFCKTDKDLKIVSNTKNKSIIRNRVLYVNVPMITKETIEFTITDNENISLYKVIVFPTTCKLIEEHKLYLSSETKIQLCKSILSKFHTKLSSNSYNIEDTDLSDIHIEEEIYFLHPNQNTNDIKKYYFQFFKKHKEILLDTTLSLNDLKSIWDAKHLIKPTNKTLENTDSESYKTSEFNTILTYIPEELLVPFTPNEDDLLWIFQLTEQNFHRYVLDIIT